MENDIISTVIKRQELKEQIEMLEQEKKQIDEFIKESLGSGTHTIGDYIISCGIRPVHRFNQSLLKKDNPALFYKYYLEKDECFFSIREKTISMSKAIAMIKSKEKKNQ